nr:hypothetical protein CFP56_30182 [Quercus suber]
MPGVGLTASVQDDPVCIQEPRMLKSGHEGQDIVQPMDFWYVDQSRHLYRRQGSSETNATHQAGEIETDDAHHLYTNDAECRTSLPRNFGECVPDGSTPPNTVA